MGCFIWKINVQTGTPRPFLSVSLRIIRLFGWGCRTSIGRGRKLSRGYKVPGVYKLFLLFMQKDIQLEISSEAKENTKT